MLAIEFTMPASRYHATPWDHHVNEGQVEWPPSPWRIARALVAVWHRKASALISEATVRPLVDKLASELPRFYLPPATATHTRHYMPVFKGSTTKVFDAFLHVDGPIQVQWPTLTLTDAERTALVVLLDRLGYLGRAESWAEARIASEIREANVVRSNESTAAGEVVRVLSPVVAADYPDWRAAMVDELSTRRLEERRAAKPDREPKLTAADKRRIAEAVPGDLFAALHAETSDLRKQGWNRPPGSRWIDYRRPADLVGVGPTRRRRKARSRLPTAARFAVTSAVPPRLTNAVSLADRVRMTLIKLSDGAPVFTGRGHNDLQLSGHEHAFFLPESSRGDGRINYLTISASMGFDDRARRAIESASRVWGHKGHDVELILVGVGQPEQLADLRAEGACRLLATAKRWRSRTPFVPTRHPKNRRSGAPKLDAAGLHIGSPRHDLLRLLELQGWPEPVAVAEREHTRLRGKRTSWLRFRLHRESGGGARGAARGYGFEIEFPEPVRGPIALGYNAHFGLGVFEPVLR